MEGDIITSYRLNLELDASDSDLIVAIDRALMESREIKDKIDRLGNINKIYWRDGTTIDFSSYHKKKSKLVDNRIFTDVETCIPIITSETPEATVVGKLDNAQKEKLKKGLEIAFEVKYKMQQKFQILVRHWFLFYLGVLKYRWDSVYGFCTENILTKRIGFDKRATSMRNCEFIWEELETTIEDLKTRFPNKKNEIDGALGKQSPKTKIKYLEFWGGGGEWVCWKLRNIILEKEKNPNWDYEDPEGNVYEFPQFPYIFMNVFSFGDETGLYDETSLIKECIPIQDGVNQLEQQILDLNEGQKRVWTVSSKAMSKQEAQELVDRTGDVLCYLDKGAPPNFVSQVQSGKPDSSLYNNLNHLLNEIDNTIGIHSTTRGERGAQETLGGRKLLMNSDYGRLDLVVRNLEQCCEEWYNAYCHMIKVYSLEGEYLSNGKEEVQLTPQDIPPKMIVMVKRGSTLPTDELTKRTSAQELASAGMIDPKTLFEEMGYANADKRTGDLYTWLELTGKIVPQIKQLQEQGQEQQGEIGGQLDRIQKSIQSPKFQQLPPEDQQVFLQQAREAINKLKQ